MVNHLRILKLGTCTSRRCNKHDSTSNNAGCWLRLTAFLSLKAPNTQSTYVQVLTEWLRFLGAEIGTRRGELAMLSASDLHAIAWRGQLATAPGIKPRFEAEGRQSAKKTGLESTQSNATICKKLAAMRRMYRVLVAAGLTNRNPFDADLVPPPPRHSGQKRPTERVDNKSILEMLDRARTKPRDAAALSALFGCGLRRSELTGLHLSDVQRTAAGTTYLHVRAPKQKKDGDRAVPPWAERSILGWLRHRQEAKAKPTGWLFNGFTGRAGVKETEARMSDSALYKLFKRYAQAVGAGKFVSPHSARATAITRLLEQGVSHRKIQEFSGHSSIQMVELYDKRRIDVDENPARELRY